MRNFMTKNSVFYLQKEVWDDVNEYHEGFKQVIKQREKTRIPFFHQSPQFAYRSHLVKYIKRVCVEKRLSHCCLHLAVYLLDIFMDNHSIIPERVLLVANACLLIAAKFEECMTAVPRITDLNATINNRYPPKEYRVLELIILRFFHWYVMFPTAAHYTHYFMQVIISKDDLKSTQGGLRTLFYNLHDAITRFLDQVIDNVHYMQCYPPSKLAAAVIGASRIEVGLSCWTEQLAEMTEYSRDELQEPIFILTKKKSFVYCQKCNLKN